MTKQHFTFFMVAVSAFKVHQQELEPTLKIMPPCGHCSGGGQVQWHQARAWVRALRSLHATLTMPQAGQCQPQARSCLLLLCQGDNDIIKRTSDRQEDATLRKTAWAWFSVQGVGGRLRALKRVGGGPGRLGTYSSCSKLAPHCPPSIPSFPSGISQSPGGWIRTSLLPLQQVGSSSHEPCCFPKPTSLPAPTFPQIKPEPSPALGSSAVLLYEGVMVPPPLARPKQGQALFITKVFLGIHGTSVSHTQSMRQRAPNRL